MQYGATVATLASTNGIANPDHIIVGQILSVPVAPYTVRPGDTLSAIGHASGDR